MNKNDLINELSSYTLTKNDARKFVNTIFDTIINALITGQKVNIQNLGSFVPKYYKSKKMYNPKKKKYLLINPREKIKFVVSKNLLKKINIK